MKQSDIISVVLVASVGVVASAFAVNALLGNPDEAYVSYKDIEVISADLAEPDAEVFNASAINPTVEVYVGDCEDVDQDGVLSQAELVACGRVEALEEPNTEDEDEDAESVGSGAESGAGSDTSSGTESSTGSGGLTFMQDEDFDDEEEE